MSDDKIENLIFYAVMCRPAIQISLCGDFIGPERTNGNFIFQNGISRTSFPAIKLAQCRMASGLVILRQSKVAIWRKKKGR
ncbi:hypothetical protein [Serratia liquefaciens]|uniref:hypothetical protein n=1 Tax=Serratia liquefaciens TaxID=614 RepID=UPI0022B9751E|nr:hypothetical protein [Serratia liquefaciens]